MSATGSSATATNDCWLAPSTDRGADPDQGTRAEFPPKHVRSWAIPSRPSQLPATSATGRIRAARVVDVRFPAV